MPPRSGGFTATAQRSELSGQGVNCFHKQTPKQGIKKAGSKGLHDWSSTFSTPEPPAEKCSECQSCHSPLPEARTWAAGGAGQRTSPGCLGLWPWGPSPPRAGGAWGHALAEALTLTEGTTAGVSPPRPRHLLKNTEAGASVCVWRQKEPAFK